MIELFIPVLFMCISDDCGFLQGQQLFKTETACRMSVKEQFTVILKDNPNQRFDVLEGTCIRVRVEKPSMQV